MHSGPYDLERAARLKREAHAERERLDSMLTEEERYARDDVEDKILIGVGSVLRVFDQLADARSLLHRAATDCDDYWHTDAMQHLRAAGLVEDPE